MVVVTPKRWDRLFSTLFFLILRIVHGGTRHYDDGGGGVGDSQCDRLWRYGDAAHNKYFSIVSLVS